MLMEEKCEFTWLLSQEIENSYQGHYIAELRIIMSLFCRSAAQRTQTIYILLINVLN